MGSFCAKLLNSLDSIGKTSHSAGKTMSSPRQEVSSQTTDTIVHSNNLCLILLPSIYAFAYLRPYEKLLVMSKLYSSRAFNECMQQVFWLIARLLSLPTLSVDNWQLASDLDTKQTILQITAAGLCRTLTYFPWLNAGAKVVLFFQIHKKYVDYFVVFWNYYMLTLKLLKTIRVNWDVNYRQFKGIFCWDGGMRWAHWHPQQK